MYQHLFLDFASFVFCQEVYENAFNYLYINQQNLRSDPLTSPSSPKVKDSKIIKTNKEMLIKNGIKR